MNKQEYISKLKKILEAPSELGGDLDIIYNSAIKRAIHLAEYLNEKPNKHKKMKEIADRYNKQQPSTNTPPHYQGTIQPIDLINAQDLNFNLGNVIKYVCRAGKKQGENILSDLEKAKDYLNFEIERVKK